MNSPIAGNHWIGPKEEQGQDDNVEEANVSTSGQSMSELPSPQLPKASEALVVPEKTSHVCPTSVLTKH